MYEAICLKFVLIGAKPTLPCSVCEKTTLP